MPSGGVSDIEGNPTGFVGHDASEEVDLVSNRLGAMNLSSVDGGANPDRREKLVDRDGLNFEFAGDSKQSSTTNPESGDESNSALSDSDSYIREDVIDLPEHACAYCGIHNVECVVRCNVVGCRKWFCNSNAGVRTTSHIIYHLIKNKHKEIKLHDNTPLGVNNLECYQCGCRNVFVLGFILAKTDSVVIILCRDPCAQQSSRPIESGSNLTDWDLGQWQPLIENRSFLPWLVKPPRESEIERACKVNLKQINKLEEAWKSDPQMKIDTILARPALSSKSEGFVVDRIPLETEPMTVLTRYDDAYQYHTIFGPLVSLEAEYHRKMKESQAQQSFILKWEVGLNQKHIVWVSFPRVDIDLRLVPGDELKLKRPADANHKAWEGEGHVIKIIGDEIALELCHPYTLARKRSKKNVELDQKLYEFDLNNAVPKDFTSGISVEFVWKSTSFDRMQTAMTMLKLHETAVSSYLYKKLLGYQVPDVDPAAKNGNVHGGEESGSGTGQSIDWIHIPNLPELNPSQADAVKAVVSSSLSLIQGPPGTGKTVTSAAVVYHLVKKGQVLVCAPSNVAVDHLTERIHQIGLRVVRLAAKSREPVASSVDHLTLHSQVATFLKKVYNWTQSSEKSNEFRYSDAKVEMANLFFLKEKNGELSSKEEKRYRSLRLGLEIEFLRAAQVICTTCVGAGDPRLKNFKFGQVLIDESTQSTEPECLIPIVLGAKQLVLVGDHCQLGPVIMCRQAAQAGLSQSLFERLIQLGHKPIRLRIQYRMHPCLSEWPSNMFYEGSLQNGVTMQQRSRSAHDRFPWPIPDLPTFFYASTTPEEIAASGTSYLNRGEASLCEKFVSYLLKTGVLPHQIGVITPYAGQRVYLLNYFKRTFSLDVVEAIEVASVDSFQGREKDYILFSCVRSNESGTIPNIGFLNDPRRLNVALTRSRYGLILLGNPRLLAKHSLWNNLLWHYQRLQLLVDGPIHNLKSAQIRLPVIKGLLGSTMGKGHQQSSHFSNMFGGGGGVCGNEHQLRQIGRKGLEFDASLVKDDGQQQQQHRHYFYHQQLSQSSSQQFVNDLMEPEEYLQGSSYLTQNSQTFMPTSGISSMAPSGSYGGSGYLFQNGFDYYSNYASYQYLRERNASQLSQSSVLSQESLYDMHLSQDNGLEGGEYYYEGEKK